MKKQKRKTTEKKKAPIPHNSILKLVNYEGDLIKLLHKGKIEINGGFAEIKKKRRRKK